MKSDKKVHDYSTIQLTIFVILRMAIGWHFLYEGISKLLTPGWSSSSYLDLSRWIFKDFFIWIASNPSILKVVDFLNIWGLILIGLGLLLGIFTRISSISGMLLLALYYLAHPPFVGLDFGFPPEGNYLMVDKNLVELIALAILTFFPTKGIFDFKRMLMIFKYKKKKLPLANATDNTTTEIRDSNSTFINRRELLKSIVALPVMGAFVFAVIKKMGWESYERKHLNDSIDAVTAATVRTFNYSGLKDLKGIIPTGHIGDLELSRVILGGNLVGGWAHARDLIYVDKLVKSYHTKDKIFETFLLAEKCGINCFLTNPVLSRIIGEYWKRSIGNIKFISDCAYRGDVISGIKMSIDNGANSCYVQGAIADKLVQEGNVELIAQSLELIRKNDLPAGIGAHRLETVKSCVDFGLEPDYWMKTVHPIDYWSAQPKQEHDNIWCTNPEETIKYMENLKQPWIAFKILAAGAIHPKIGFQYAFKNGADFICVGMYDFQIVDDVNMALEALANSVERNRNWVV